MRALAHLFDDLAHEGIEIGGIAAGDEALVGHDRLIAPLSAGIDHARSIASSIIWGLLLERTKRGGGPVKTARGTLLRRTC
jgi:hypothetical protein